MSPTLEDSDDQAVAPKIRVEKGVKRAVESQARGSIQPPRHEEVRDCQNPRRHPSQSNRHRRKQKRNAPPFTRVCAVAVHTSPARLIHLSRTGLYGPAG